MEAVTVSKEDIRELREEFDQHRKEENQRIDALTLAMIENTEAIDELKRSTEGVVQMYKDLQAAARVGNATQNFVIWVSKWGVAGTVVAACVTWIVEHFSLK